MKREPIFPTEADLCAAFSAWAAPQGWVSYAETAGFDILLVHGDGTQIGIQAKLKFNLHVLAQISEDRSWSKVGPDFRAVLVPTGGDRDLCAALGVTLLQHDSHWSHHWPNAATEPRAPVFHPKMESPHRHYEGWHYRNPEQRCKLPDYVPDVIAGASGPTQLTEWKVNALRIAATLELRGYVTREDFSAVGIDRRRWTNGWLIPGAVAGQWIRGPWMPDFAAQHPVVYPKVLAEMAKKNAAAHTPVLL